MIIMVNDDKSIDSDDDKSNIKKKKKRIELNDIINLNDFSDVLSFKKRHFQHEIKENITSVWIDKRHKFAYCDIPKCVTTKFKTLFRCIALEIGHFKLWKGKDIHAVTRHWAKYNDMPYYTNYSSLNSIDGWIKFVVIRDPLDRLLSSYLNRCIQVPLYNNNPRHECDKYSNRVGGLENLTFRSFVNQVIKELNNTNNNKIYRINPHWRPQYSYCKLYEYFNKFDNIIIYKHESIVNDTLKFLKKYNLENYYYFDDNITNMFNGNQQITRQKNKNKNKNHIINNTSILNDDILHYSKYYDKNLAIKVIRAYSMDFKLLNFSLPIWFHYLSDDDIDDNNVTQLIHHYKQEKIRLSNITIKAT